MADSRLLFSEWASMALDLALDTHPVAEARSLGLAASILRGLSVSQIFWLCFRFSLLYFRLISFSFSVFVIFMSGSFGF